MPGLSALPGLTPTMGNQNWLQNCRSCERTSGPLACVNGGAQARPGSEPTTCMVLEMEVLWGLRWAPAWVTQPPRGWWHAHRSPSVPAGHVHVCRAPGRGYTGHSELKQLKSHHLCLSRVSHKYESLLLRIPLIRLTAVCAWKAAVRSRAINWIVRAQARKMIAVFLQLPASPRSTEESAFSLCLCGKTGVQVKSVS